ncbi:hypothetical protein B5X24_HaOG204603 [Helicoverpa armigera]|nr:hypothetical protein B5X24_HaOG204603 [Helicoverpa armigera]
MDRSTKGHHLNEVFVHGMSEQVPEKVIRALKQASVVLEYSQREKLVHCRLATSNQQWDYKKLRASLLTVAIHRPQ